jgi:predicted nicotinamide N-methyase
VERVGDLVEERLELGAAELSLLRPVDPEALLDEEAFEREEFLPYWAEIWPSGVTLARLVATREVTGQRVLELGCGLGLPSLAAAAGGASVLATDWAPDAIRLLQENARRNNLTLGVEVVNWARPGQRLAGTWDLVLAADVLYERRDTAPLVELLSQLQAREVVIADPGRPASHEFLASARERFDVESRLELDPRVELHALRPRGSLRAGRTAYSAT